MKPKFEVFASRNKQWRWRLRAKNGRVVANSGESYRRKIDCLTSIKLVKKAGKKTQVEFL